MKFNEISLLPSVIISPEACHLCGERTFQGIPSIEKFNNRMFAVWYSGGTTECYKNFVCLAVSDDDGMSWSDTVKVVQPQHFPVRAFDPELWVAPNGKLYLFYAQGSGGEDGKYDCYDGKAGAWMCELLNPEAEPEKFTFSEPVRFADGIMMNKPTALSDGTWAFACSLWSEANFYDPELGLDPGAYMIVSGDEGKTFSIRGRIEMREVEGGPCFDEHMFAERSDGSIVAWMRVGKGIAQSISTDRGATWSKPEVRKDISGTASRFFLRKLASGNWLLVYNDSDKRTNMTAWLSTDEGRSWPEKILLDDQDSVSYPDGVEMENGTIYITYDRDRVNGGFIYLVKFNEKDIISGNTGNIRRSLISSTRPVPPAEPQA